MIQFGMPTLLETNTVAQASALCAELELSFLELNTNFPQYQAHLLCPEELNRLSREYGIFYTIHLNDEMAVAEFNPLVAEGYRAAVLQTIDLAKKIGATILNMHLSEGARYTTPAKIVYFYDAYRSDYLDGMRRFRDVCTQAIGNSDIHICMENCGGYQNFQTDALDILLESPAFGLTMDIGHNYCAGGVDEPWITAHKQRLYHMHMHDAKDGKRDHLALGTGELNIPKYIDLARTCDCTVVLETKTTDGLRQSAQWIKRQESMYKHK